MFFNGIRLTIKCLNGANLSRVSHVKTVPQLQKYSDWYHRQPAKVVNEEEILQYAEAAEGPNEYLEKTVKKRDINVPLKPRVKKRDVKRRLKPTPDVPKLKDDGSVNCTELKENDGTLTSLMMSVRSRKTRDRESRIILEGHRLIVDAIDSGATPEIIVFSRNQEVLKLPLPDKGVKLFKIPYRAMQIWSTLTTPPGIMGFFKLPAVEEKKPAPDALPMTIVCDNVRDPGNMGSILRAAAAVGCLKVVTLKGCVDIWDPKVLKTAAGSHFRLPIFASKTWEDIPQFINPDANIYVADNNILNEKDNRENTTENINDDKPNTATNEEEEEGTTEYLDEIEIEVDDKTARRKRNRRSREVKLAMRLTSKIPVIPYYATDYTTAESIIVVGGETEGLSLEALNLVNDANGIRINIPMTNGVESLNTGMALGIVAFEIKRQFAVSEKNKIIQ